MLPFRESCRSLDEREAAKRFLATPILVRITRRVLVNPRRHSPLGRRGVAAGRLKTRVTSRHNDGSPQENSLLGERMPPISATRPATCLATCCLLILSVLPTAAARAQSIEVRDGERIVLLGDAFVERLQAHGFLETQLLSRLPQKNLVIRNLGWSGDTVQGIARAVFGSPEDGYKRLLKDTQLVEPTLIVVCYGANEAHAGQPGLDTFCKQLGRLLDDLESEGARLALLAPTRQTPVGDYSPDDYNAKLQLYIDELRQTAEQRGLPFVDLNQHVHNDWKANGVHFSQYGYWRMADALAAAFGAVSQPWQLRLDVKEQSYDAVNVAVSDLAWNDDGVEFRAVDRQLPKPARPEHAPRNDDVDFGRVVVRNLEPGRYRLTVGEQALAEADAAQWADGVALRTARGGQQQVAELRSLINDKNQLFFHRYRPQNETYLFLFRKHEQGKNAVETLQFDPLIKKLETKIEQLRKPTPHAYQLSRIAN